MHNIDTSTIKAKIRALLAKAESTEHEGERELFLDKAQELMAKHQLELYDLGDEDPLGWLECETRYQAGPMAYKSDLHNAVGYFYGCQVVRSRKVFRTDNKAAKFGVVEGWVLNFAGCESSRLTVELMFPFIWDQVNKQAKTMAARTMHNQSKCVREIAKALTCRIFAMIRERKATPAPQFGSCFALVVVNQIDALVAARYPNLKEAKPKTVSLKATAVELAKGINLSRQMNSKDVLRLQ